MKVSVASVGRFHAFDLASELLRHEVLHKLYTGYPIWKVPEYLKRYAVTCPWLTVPYMASGRYGQEWLQNRLAWPVARLFDWWLCRVLEPCDVLHAWASYAPEATAKAKSMGITTVCDRGSTNVLYQHAVLEKEYAKYGLSVPPLHPRLMAAELQQYRVADAITVPSQIAQASFHDYGYSPFVCPYGVDLDRFPWRKHEGSTFRVLFVGALSIRKGIPLLIEALRDWHPTNAEVWLVGPILNEIRQWLRDLPSHFHVNGPIQQRFLHELFAQSSVLVLPSAEEGLALVLGQALACGLPVIASHESGLEELPNIGRNTIVLQERSTDAIRYNVNLLYGMKSAMYASMRAAIADIRQNLRWSHYGDRMMVKYARILAKSR